MFCQEFTCPKGEDTKKIEKCEGCRINGTLKNVCAGCCPAYKKYVKQDV